MRTRFTGYRLQVGGILALTALLASVGLPAGAAGGGKGGKMPGAHRAATREQAEKLFVDNKFNQAREAYRAALKTAPTSEALRVGLIRTLIRLDDWQGAIREGEKATAAAPQAGDAHGILALALMRGGRPDRAETEAKRALALDKNNYWGLVASGRVALWNENKTEAHNALKAATQSHPQWPEAWHYYIDSFAPGEGKARFDALRAYVALAPHGQPHDRAMDGLEGRMTARRTFDENTGRADDGPLAEAERAGEAGGKNGKSETGDKSAAKPKNADTSMTFAFERSEDDILLPVYFNGERFKMLFDTGAGSSLALGRDAAQRLSLATLGDSVVRGVSGKETMHIGRVSSFEVGSQTWRSVPVEFIDNNIGEVEDGLLGGAVFKQFAVTIDFENNLMTLTSGKETALKTSTADTRVVRVPMKMVGNYIFVPIKVEGRPSWAMVDTGAQGTTLLSLALARQLAAKRPDTTSQEVEIKHRSGVGSTNTAFTALLFRFAVEIGLLNGDKTVYFGEVDPIYGASMMDEQVSRNFDFQLGAIVGISYLARAKRVTFDYPRHIMTLEFPDASGNTNSATP